MPTAGHTQLQMPDINLADVTAAAADEEAVEAAEQAVISWTATISSTLQRESGKVTPPGGPLLEVEFWRARHAGSHKGPSSPTRIL